MMNDQPTHRHNRSLSPRVRPVVRGGRVALSLIVLVLGAQTVSTPSWAFGRTLDQIFRGTVRGENGGELPPYVVNRGLPPYPEPKPLTPEQAAGLGRGAGAGAVSEDLTKDMPWDDVVKEIAGGNPGPFAVEAVRRRAEQADGQAVELLAWMSANGVGVHRDLPQAFDLYARAEELGVKSAKDNARAIYRAMSTEERRTVFNPFN